MGIPGLIGKGAMMAKNVEMLYWEDFVVGQVDEFGDKLGNGVYLYRVITSLDGQTAIEQRSSGADQYFKSGFGKMYLLR